MILKIARPKATTRALAKLRVQVSTLRLRLATMKEQRDAARADLSYAKRRRVCWEIPNRMNKKTRTWK